MTMTRFLLVMLVGIMLAITSLSITSALADGKTYPPQQPEGTTSSQAPAAGNMGTNSRESEQLTPTDQSSSPADVETTRLIREQLVADSSLSMSAQNVKIITVNGITTLRGSVKSPAEHDKVLAAAKKFVGTNTLNDMLEIEAY
jgi:osmotically-inducible protein OsmY